MSAVTDLQLPQRIIRRHDFRGITRKAEWIIMKKDSVSLFIILASVVIIGIIIAIGFSISNRRDPLNQDTSATFDSTEIPENTDSGTKKQETTSSVTDPPALPTSETANSPSTVSPAPVTETPETASVTTTPEAVTYPDLSGSISQQVDEKGYFIVRTDWKAVNRTADSATLQLSFVLRVTSIGVGTRNATLTVNGKDYSIKCSEAEASYEKGVRHEIVIATYEVPVTLSSGEGDIPIKFVYNYNGTFSKISYHSITVEGVASIK